MDGGFGAARGGAKTDCVARNGSAFTSTCFACKALSISATEDTPNARAGASGRGKSCAHRLLHRAKLHRSTDCRTNRAIGRTSSQLRDGTVPSHAGHNVNRHHQSASRNACSKVAGNYRGQHSGNCFRFRLQFPEPLQCGFQGPFGLHTARLSSQSSAAQPAVIVHFLGKYFLILLDEKLIFSAKMITIIC